jgi:hypothetical protein
VTTDLDILLTPDGTVRADRRSRDPLAAPGGSPMRSWCLAAAQVLLSERSEHHWPQMCYARLGHVLPYLPRRPGYHKRLVAARLAGITVVSLERRLTPEHPHPAARAGHQDEQAPHQGLRAACAPWPARRSSVPSALMSPPPPRRPHRAAQGGGWCGRSRQPTHMPVVVLIAATVAGVTLTST